MMASPGSPGNGWTRHSWTRPGSRRRSSCAGLDCSRKCPCRIVGRKPAEHPSVSTRRVVVDKRSEECLDLRCRLVAREFEPKGGKDQPDIVVAMPLLEAKKMLFCKAALGVHWWSVGRWHRRQFRGKLNEGEVAFIRSPVVRTGQVWETYLLALQNEAGSERFLARLLVQVGGVRDGEGQARPDHSLLGRPRQQVHRARGHIHLLELEVAVDRRVDQVRGQHAAEE